MEPEEVVKVLSSIPRAPSRFGLGAKGGFTKVADRWVCSNEEIVEPQNSQGF